MRCNFEDLLKNRRWRRLCAIACILLVIFASSAELIHKHESGRVNPDCSLCVTAHSVVQATVYTIAPVPMLTLARLAETQPDYVRHRLDIRLSIRPPPVSPSFA
jgi:hypothetical protein